MTEKRDRIRGGIRFCLKCDRCGAWYRLFFMDAVTLRRSAACNGWRVALDGVKRDTCPDCKEKERG